MSDILISAASLLPLMLSLFFLLLRRLQLKSIMKTLLPAIEPVFAASKNLRISFKQFGILLLSFGH